MKKNKTICKSIVIADFIQSPIIEIAGEVSSNLASKKSLVEILIVDDYFPSVCFSRRLPKLLKWFDVPLTFNRVLKKNASKDIKCTYRIILENASFKEWPKSLKETYLKIIDHETTSINKFLVNLKLNDIAIGEGILSTIISLAKDNNPNYLIYKKEIEEVFSEFNRKYKFFVDFFSEGQNYENCYLFNGRFASNKALLAALSFLNIDLKIFYYERSHTLNKFTVRNHIPHDRYMIYEEIKNIWKNKSSLKEAKLIGGTYFIQKSNGHGLNWYSYSKGIGDQKSSKIINSLVGIDDKNTKNIIFFTSSEDEFESLGEAWYKSENYISQFDIIKNLSTFVSENNYKLFIRVHPNFRSSSIRVREKWHNFFCKIQTKNINVIASDSEASSYGLINKMDLVIVYGSTIGIEAAFLGKKVIVTGPSYYADINAKINVIDSIQSLKKLIPELLSNENHDERDVSESTLPYGYWCYKTGMKFKNYIPLSPLDGKFFGKDLDYIFLIIVKIKNFLSF